MKAMVDKETCTGCGLCTQMCDAVFEMNGDKAMVKGDSVPEGAEDCAKQAEEACPPNAISVE